MTNYTKSQREVIASRGENLLVSASAGTGKTTVMVERIFQLIASGEVDISNLMVVTFTQLAAAEMKQRLSFKLASNCVSDEIASQLERIDSCAISTLHSFCADIIRQYFYLIDIDPSYTILDSATTATLSRQAVEDVFNEYGEKNDEIYNQLYDIFATNRKVDEFVKVVLKQYNFSRNMVDYNEWYSNSRNKYLEIGENGELANMLIDDINTTFSSLSVRWRKVGEHFASIGMEKHSQHYFERSNELHVVASGSIKNYIKWLKNIEWKTFVQLRQDSLPDGVNFDDLKKMVDPLKDDCKKAFENYDWLRSSSWETLTTQTTANVKYMDKLVELVGAFSCRFSQLKKARGVLDYGDLEHLAIEVLNHDEALSQLQNKYKMVFVDEYQDTNSVQEAIISKISRKDNLFVVGDLKQSIYAFRGSEPTLFLNRASRYNEVGGDTSGKVIELNENFRSDKRILNFVNDVFSHVMTPEFGQVDYRGTSKLEGSKCSDTVAVHVDIVSKDKQETLEPDPLYDITKSTESSQILTAGEVIAQRIIDVVGSTITLSDGTSHVVGYGDIAILSRSTKASRVEDITTNLIKRNIPVQCNSNSEVKGKEIREIIAMMRVIDNITDDINLVGVCLSSYSNISHQQLADIAIATKVDGGNWYTRLGNYATNNNDELATKVTNLLNLINHLRLVARSSTVDRVVLELMDSTDYHLRVQALPNGQLRVKGLYDFLQELSQKSYNQSVDKFLQYLDDGEENKKDISSSDNAVTLMTMHGSKGLEFPVVFVVNTDKDFNERPDKLACNKQMGLAIKYFDFESMSVSQTLGHYCTSLSLKRSGREEEMRILYVALTRAKYKLFVVATGQECFDTDVDSVLSSKTHIGWIMASYNATYGSDAKAMEAGVQVTHWVDKSQLTNTINENLLANQQDSIDEELASLSYRYPYQTDVVTKVVSSQLDALKLDESQRYVTPALATYDPTPMLVGTAYHAVYEQIKLNATVGEIELVLNELVASGVILADIASQVDVKLVHATINNEHLKKLLVGKVYREIPFMLNTTQSALGGSSDEGIILQGIIDMLVVNGTTATVIDFKYTGNSYGIKRKYASQIDSYKLAVKSIIDVSEVNGYILSIKDNKVIEM